MAAAAGAVRVLVCVRRHAVCCARGGEVVQIWGAFAPQAPQQGTVPRRSRYAGGLSPTTPRKAGGVLGGCAVSVATGGRAARGRDGAWRGWFLDRGRTPGVRVVRWMAGSLQDAGGRASGVGVGGGGGGGARFSVGVVDGVVGLFGPRSLLEAEGVHAGVGDAPGEAASGAPAPMIRTLAGSSASGDGGGPRTGCRGRIALDGRDRGSGTCAGLCGTAGGVLREAVRGRSDLGGICPPRPPAGGSWSPPTSPT